MTSKRTPRLAALGLTTALLAAACGAGESQQTTVAVPDLDEAQIPQFVYTVSPSLQFDPAVDETTRAKVRAALAENARAHPLLADAYSREELLGTETRNAYVEAWRLSFSTLMRLR